MSEQTYAVEERDLTERPAGKRLETAENDPDEDEARELEDDPHHDPDRKIGAVLQLAAQAGAHQREVQPRGGRHQPPWITTRRIAFDQTNRTRTASATIQRH